MSIPEYFNALAEAVTDHYSEENDDNLHGIIDHIYGYKTLIGFTLIGA